MQPESPAAWQLGHCLEKGVACIDHFMHRKEIAQFSYCLSNWSNNNISVFQIRKKRVGGASQQNCFSSSMVGMTFKEKKTSWKETAEI